MSWPVRALREAFGNARNPPGSKDPERSGGRCTGSDGFVLRFSGARTAIASATMHADSAFIRHGLARG
ncbi:hypothetical protein BIWAKO_05279 [Bosea sp. BIWAKO-01]|nr:hypothetical protein BIWAKO_05279 [Bosea sp. BIWAKO-01]